MAYGVVHLPFYATGFRGDDLEAALSKLAPISLRYGAIRYDVFRSRDDRYKFVLQVEFAEKSQWDAFYFGEEFTDMRAACSSWLERQRRARRAAPRRRARRRARLTLDG